LGISAIAAVTFVLWERARAKSGKNVLLDLNLFRITSFRNGSLAALIISMGEFGILFAIPLWLQNVLGLSPISAGLVLLWLAGGSFVASGVGGALSGKLAPARAVQLGVMLELIGVAGVALFVSPEPGWVVVAPCLFIYGIGIGLATAQLTGVIMVDVPMEKAGQGSGSQSTVRQIGSALGIAVLGTMLFTGTQSSLESKLNELTVPAEQSQVIVEAVVDSAGAAIPQLAQGLQAQGVPAVAATEIVSAAGEAFTDGAKLAAWAAAGFLLLGLFSSLSLGRTRSARQPK
jgi:Na+/melibiose symporter-like transporter